jgi:DNA-binding GntR family transcriptional regulator
MSTVDTGSGRREAMVAEAMSLLGLEKTSLRQQALTALRRAITTGEIPPGKHLVETELSEMLNISRGTLREALRQLQQEGLVAAGARGRLAVRNLDAKEIRDIFAVRAALETLAAQLLCTLGDRTAAVGALRDALRHMDNEAKHGIERGVEADLEFHRVLCRLTGNEPLLHAWEQLEGSIRMSIMWGGMERGVKNMSVDRHAEIVDAIDSADSGLAASVIKTHMDSAADVLVTS